MIKKAEGKLKLNEKVNIIFSPVQRKIEIESSVFKYERTNINLDEYRFCVRTYFKNIIVEVEFESIEWCGLYTN